MELASPFPEEPVSQVEADVPLEPISLQAETADLEFDLHSYERPLAASPFGTIEHVPDWDDTHAMVKVIWESERFKDSVEMVHLGNKQ